MATAVGKNQDEKISIGAVLGNSFAIIGDNPVATLGIAFVLGGLPTLLLTIMLPGIANDDYGLFSTATGIAFYFLFLFVSIFCALLVQAAITHAAVSHALGERKSIGQCLSASLSRLVPLLALSILIVVGVAFGILLLIVPGIILALFWCVAPSALIVEDVGILGALARSRALTKGNRGRIFVLMVIAVVIIWIMSLITGLALVFTGTAANLALSVEGASMPFAYLAVSTIVNTLTTTFWTTLLASLYVALRTTKEGHTVDRLADVFA